MLHWGQRKLMLAEIELLVAFLLRGRLIRSRSEPRFLTEYYETGSWVVQLGCADFGCCDGRELSRSILSG